MSDRPVSPFPESPESEKALKKLVASAGALAQDIEDANAAVADLERRLEELRRPTKRELRLVR